MANRIFAGITIILFIVLIAVVAFFLFYKSSATTQTAQEISSGNINIGVLNSLRNHEEKGILSSAILTANFQGRVVEVLDKPGSFEGGLIYERGFIIVSLSKPTERVPLVFRQADVPVLRIYERMFFFKKGIKFSDIKTGDALNIESVIDLKKDSLYNRVKIEIIRL